MRILLSALALLAVAYTTPAQAQDWPSKQVTIVVPFSAGGTTDMFARILSQGLQQKYGTPFIVENRVGAGGNIGAGIVAKRGEGRLHAAGRHGQHACHQPVHLQEPDRTTPRRISSRSA